MRTLVLGEGVADERGRVNVVSELLPATLPDVVEVCESFETEHSEEPCFPEGGGDRVRGDIGPAPRVAGHSPTGIAATADPAELSVARGREGGGLSGLRARRGRLEWLRRRFGGFLGIQA